MLLSNVLQLWPMKHDPASAPNQIRALRATRRMSQQTLADAINVSKVTVHKLEVGTMQLTLDYLTRIGDVFGVTAVDVLNREDQNNFLRQEEMDLVRRYRAADPVQREMIQRVAEPRDAQDAPQPVAAPRGRKHAA